MKKKIFTQIIFAILLFLMGFAFGGYRGTKSQIVRSFAESLNAYSILHSMAKGQENEDFMKITEQGINVRAQILRELERGDHNRDLWLNAFSLEEGMLDDESVKMIIREAAKYSISRVPNLTEENLAYLQTKRE